MSDPKKENQTLPSDRLVRVVAKGCFEKGQGAWVRGEDKNESDDSTVQTSKNEPYDNVEVETDRGTGYRHMKISTRVPGGHTWHGGPLW